MLKNVQMQFKRYLLGFVVFSLALSVHAQSYGLRFKGQQAVLDDRTGLNLTPDGFISFKDEFELSFDFKLDDIEAATFGYVFRIVSKDGKNIDLITNWIPDQRLNLVVGQSGQIQTIHGFNQYDDHWVTLRTKIFLKEGKMVFYTPDSFYVSSDIGFKPNDEFKIFFGANEYGQFKNTDVPSMNIKEVKLFEDGKLQYYWPLNEEKGSIVVDRINGQEAIAANPLWLKLAHRSWTKELEKDYAEYVSISYDDEYEKLFILGKHQLEVYSIEKQEWTYYAYGNQADFLRFNEKEDYRPVYDSKNKVVYCYTTDFGWPVYRFDLSSKLWNSIGNLLDQFTKYRHHNAFYDKEDNSVLLFGGYGEHSYNNTVTLVDLEKGLKSGLPTNDSVFYPRYLAGSFSLHDTIYIMGGFGSKSGNQLVNPHSYHDLIAYDVSTGAFSKKFDLQNVPDDMVVASSMWVDSLTRNYYGLVYEKSLYDGYLQLVVGNLDSPEIIQLGDKVPFRFHDMRSNAGLFYSQSHKKLLAYTSYMDHNGKTTLSVYSIGFPPNENIVSVVNEFHFSKFFWLFLIVLIGIIGAVLLWLLRQRRIQQKQSNKAGVHTRGNEDTLSLTYEEPQQKDHSEDISLNKEKYQVMLFGGFQVFDNEYSDITNKFSPLLKELFLLILLYTHKNNKGISSEKMTEILWYDKSEKSARNNRSVNLAKLRTLLNEVGGWQLSKKTGYWKILHGDQHVLCDFLQYLDITGSYTNLNKERVSRLMQISAQGPFLFNLQHDWLDEFKALVSGNIIDALIAYGSECDIEEDPEFIVKLANSVFNCDAVNEEAMALKCRAEHLMGKHSLARSSYDKFCKEYRFMYGQEYNVPFIDVINHSDQAK